jgi:hypothetical protein
MAPQEDAAILRCRSAIAAAAVAVTFFGCECLGLEKSHLHPMHTSILTGWKWLDEVLAWHPDRCCYICVRRKPEPEKSRRTENSWKAENSWRDR